MKCWVSYPSLELLLLRLLQPTHYCPADRDQGDAERGRADAEREGGNMKMEIQREGRCRDRCREERRGHTEADAERDAERRRVDAWVDAERQGL